MASRSLAGWTYIPTRGQRIQKPDITIAADLGWFPTPDLLAALQLVSREFGVRGSQILQLSALPPAKIIVEIGLPIISALGPNLAASAIWDGLKFLLLRFRAGKEALAKEQPSVQVAPPFLDFEVTGSDFSARAQVRTEDPEVLRSALACMNSAIETVKATGRTDIPSTETPYLMWFDEEAGTWVTL